ncbi:MAG TPA: hypothetical protein VGK63_01525, partial [Candidatus Limnocylindrales bacterium]
PPGDPGRVNVSRDGEAVRVEGAAYVLSLRPDRPFVELSELDGEARALARLNPIGAVDTVDGLDATVRIGEPRVDRRDRDILIELPVESRAWRSKRAIVRCADDEVGLSVAVARDGRARLSDVRLLGGWYPTDRRWPAAWYRSRIEARSLVPAAPADPSRIALDPNEGVRFGVSGGGQPGRGSWFLTPPPFVLAFSPLAADARDRIPEGPWTSVAVRSALAGATFSELAYEPVDGGFHLRLAYDGMTDVVGEWRSPEVVVGFAAANPYAAIARETERLRASGLARASSVQHAPAWWRQPIFCGWGAQSALARAAGRPAAAGLRSSRADYDQFLETLEGHAIVPGTIVIDDRWQSRYGLADPDPDRWPDLAGWIAERHERAQRVLLWWKAWDADGVPAEWCIRTSDDRPVAADPSHPDYRRFLAAEIGRVVGPPPEGLGADGLKLDFTAQTPSAPGLVHHGPEWGVGLLHRLLATIHDAAKATRPDAMVVAHAPNPLFADVADAVRLNDLLRLDDPEPLVPIVAQARHRAAIARAACPELLIETDDWAMPSLAEWRAYLAVKPELGIPSLYYADRVDPSGEALEDADYEAVAATWRTWRARQGLPDPGRPTAQAGVAR